MTEDAFVKARLTPLYPMLPKVAREANVLVACVVTPWPCYNALCDAMEANVLVACVVTPWPCYNALCDAPEAHVVKFKPHNVDIPALRLEVWKETA